MSALARWREAIHAWRLPEEFRGSEKRQRPAAVTRTLPQARASIRTGRGSPE
jgi:hypothetical protein